MDRPASGPARPAGPTAWLVRACYRPRIVRAMLLPCHIGMCIPSAGTALGMYASKLWTVLASLLMAS